MEFGKSLNMVPDTSKKVFLKISLLALKKSKQDVKIKIRATRVIMVVLRNIYQPTHRKSTRRQN